MSDRATAAVAATLLVVCIVGAGFASRSIAEQRREQGLVLSMEGTEGMPPHVALATAALGTFRGLAVDVLWVRADALQTKGEFFEAQTLSQWITALQPRFPRVWGFQAWNLAYNISVCTKVPEERWGWVNRGISLLRDQGIRLNPQDASLPMELAWIFFHKVGGKNDREHWYYKARLAREFREILGDMTGGRTTAQAIDRFRRIVDAPDTIEAFTDQPMREALALLAEHGEKPDEKFLRMLGRVILYTNSTDTNLFVGKSLPTGTNRPLAAALLARRDLATEIFDRLVPHLQKRVLVDRYRMDPAFMLAQMEAFGPLDWAHPQAHGIYWSEKAIALGQETRRREALNELTIVKTRLGNLQSLMRSGRIEFDPLSDRIDVLPDPRFIEGYERGIQNAIGLIQSDKGLSAAEFGLARVEDLLVGYESFLQQATVFSYLYGDEREAAGCFGKLRTIAADDGRGDQPLYNEGLEGFLAIKLGDVMEIDLSNTRQFIDAMVQRAMMDGLAKGRLDTFNKFIRLAYRVYDRRYGASAPGTVHVSKEAKLPPFPQVVDASFESAMKQSSNPLLVRARIWSWAPDEIKQRTWPRLGDLLAAQAREAGFDAERVFRAPPQAAGKDPSQAADKAGPAASAAPDDAADDSAS
ncbi:MAG: hypothetical protein EBZ59_01115 [Planctomycetia bacterium]|nr:hypothetical protein [Planctomycetia bacterium]